MELTKVIINNVTSTNDYTENVSFIRFIIDYNYEIIELYEEKH